MKPRPSNLGISFLLFAAGLIIFFPLAVRLSDSFATLPWNPAVDARVLLVFRDHIELRPISALSTFSPRAAGADYTFLIPAERKPWVEKQLQLYSTPTPDSSWRLTTKSLGPDHQQIGIELRSDGIYGMIYDATNETVSPKKTRQAGPGFAFIVGGTDLVFATLFLTTVHMGRRLGKLGDRNV